MYCSIKDTICISVGWALVLLFIYLFLISFVMKTLVNIYAQVEENYGAHTWNGQGECPQHWKKKGGRIFQVNLDVDYLMYDEERSLNAFKRLLQDKSHEGYRYTYTDHEIVWQEPIVLDDDKFLEYVHAQKRCDDVEC